MDTSALATPARVSANEGVVLGLLSRGPASGYELLRRIRRSVGFFWTPARSHVYALLPRLERLGYATARQIAQSHAPDKTVYEITEAGREAVRAWLSSPELLAGPPRNPFLVKLFFGDLLEPAELAAHVRERREAIAAELAELEEIAADVDPDESPYGWLALAYGLEVDRAILRWAELARRTLEERS